MRKFIIPLLAGTILYACHGKTNQSDAAKSETDSAKNEPYYPIVDYIKSQVAYVDSTPLAIEKQVFIKGKRTDSTIIDLATFNKLAQEFEQPDLNLNSIKPLYEENKYEDLSIKSLSFNYSTKAPDQELKEATVLLNPDTKKVRNIIIKKIRTSGDTTITINGLWKNNMNFQLNYFMQPKAGPAIEKQIKIIWDRPMNN